MDPVLLCTVHHEGAGAPSDVPRGEAGGYTYWIGDSRFECLRTVWASFATLGFNHVSLDVCLSGNRMVYPVTDKDLRLIGAACADARQRGYVVERPKVRAHKDSPGSSTVCPGTYTMKRWPVVVAAVQISGAGPPPPPPKVSTMPCIISAHDGGYWIVKADGAVESFGGAEFHGSIFGRLPEGRTITSAVGTPSGHGYWLISDVGNVYAFGDAQWHGNA